MEKTVSLSQSLIFFWLKGTITVDSNFVKTSLANNILGFIPAGKDSQNIPLKNISAAAISTKYNFKNLIIGIVVILIALSAFTSSLLGGLILLIIGVSIFSNGILTNLIIQRAGSNYVISVPFFEKSKLQNIQKDIETALVNDIDKTNLNMFFDKKEQTNN